MKVTMVEAQLKVHFPLLCSGSKVRLRRYPMKRRPSIADMMEKYITVLTRKMGINAKKN